jgi:hypothetical protein
MDNGGTDSLTPAATLAAVVVGGLLAWWVQWWQAKRREEGEAKAAARVVQGDLAIAASSLQDMVERDQHWYGFYDLWLPNWGERQAVLALHMTPEHGPRCRGRPDRAAPPGRPRPPPLPRS